MNDSRDLIESHRFAIQKRLGSGGMGVVFQAFDRERQETVALKVLHTNDASALYRFKKEFRTLADVAHPNLVSLYELIAEDEQWFFTMEIVEGQSFFEFVRPEVSDGEPDRALALKPGELEGPGLVGQIVGGLLDKARLRLALRQLVEGVQALHEAGKLHRDLKPSNVMVTADGRLVILDFGLATELAPDRQSSDSGLAGTVAYMAPEQAKSEGATTASDWYAVGVILFQALTGRLPFVGSLYDVLVGKQDNEAPSPSEVVADLPGDLVDLCERLLALDPEKRPTGAEVLEFFGDETKEISATSVPILIREGELIGREKSLSMLKSAFLSSRSGQATSVYVHGASGMGKTTLIESFLDSLVKWSDATVLRGRCYEREMVPYKALDGVIDSLSRYLMSLEEHRIAELLPKDVHALLRLFPVLRRIYPLLRAPRERQDSPDLLTLRRRAFEALRELLSKLAAGRPLALFIDDLQWADADSTALLEDLLRPPDPPTLLLLASFRSEEIEKKPFLQELLAHTGTRSCRQVRVKALREEEIRELAVALLDKCYINEPILQAIVKESRGSPFLVEQLARFIQINRDALRTGLSLVEMLEERIRQLPEGARELVLTMAAANRPINATVAHLAAGLEGDERALVSRLRAAHFVRSSGSARRIELYHDRVREALATLLDAIDVQRIHRRLADALVFKGFDDPAALYEHYLGAGDEEAAAEQAVLAAEKAFAALAFDPAARFYRKALEMKPATEKDRLELMRGLARSLANAGRSAESATVYLEVAEAAAVHALEAQCRAAEQYLLGGYIDRGLAVARGVLAAVGLKMASGPRQALVSLLFNRLKLRLRGLSFTERAASDIPKQDLVRIDTCWAVANGLSLADTVRGSDFQTRHLLLALAAGEPYRVARALAMEGSFMATSGVLKRARQLQEHAMRLARRVESPHAIGLATMQIGLIAYFNGQWREATRALDEAATLLNDRCSGVVWEVTICRRFSLGALMYLGEIAELQHLVPLYLAEAKERGNVYLGNTARARLNIVWLASDDPETGRKQLEEGRSTEPPRGFTVGRFNELMAHIQADLYCGEAAAARDHLRANWDELEKSLLLRVRIVRVEALQARARTALAMAADGGETMPLVRIVTRAAAKIEAVKRPWADPLAMLLRAGLAAVQDDRERCAKLLHAAALGFDGAEMALYAAITRRRLGQALGESRGGQLIAEADTWMRGQRIVDPIRMTAMMAPGFREE